MNLKLFTKANDWGEETGVVLLEEKTLDVTNSRREKRACIDEFNHQITGDGLGFVISNTDLFYFENGNSQTKFIDYPINADGSLGESESRDFSVGEFDSSTFSTVVKPVGLGTFIRSDKYPNNDNAAVAAVSAPDTNSPEELDNSGAIAFYTRVNDSWHLKGTVYGVESNDKLGLYRVEFEDQHDLVVTSNNYFVDYVSDVLVRRYAIDFSKVLQIDVSHF